MTRSSSTKEAAGDTRRWLSQYTLRYKAGSICSTCLIKLWSPCSWHRSRPAFFPNTETRHHSPTAWLLCWSLVSNLFLLRKTAEIFNSAVVIKGNSILSASILYCLSSRYCYSQRYHIVDSISHVWYHINSICGCSIIIVNVSLRLTDVGVYVYALQKILPQNNSIFSPVASNNIFACQK